MWMEVVPFTGTWIETSLPPMISGCDLSSPSRGRGLKPPLGRIRAPLIDVVPFTGTWIETISSSDV